jgi:NCS1 family nucleobase:cation symporter-1
MNNTEAIIKPSYDAKLTNQDLAPLKANLGRL